MTSNLDRFRDLDDAYNVRDWDAYSAMLHENFRGWMLGGTKIQGKVDHIRQAREFCTLSRDNQVQNAPYIASFADGDWTCTIANLTGTIAGESKSEGHMTPVPTKRRFETSFATIARWQGGKIVEEHEFLNAQAIMQQVGVSV